MQAFWDHACSKFSLCKLFQIRRQLFSTKFIHRNCFRYIKFTFERKSAIFILYIIQSALHNFFLISWIPDAIVKDLPTNLCKHPVIYRLCRQRCKLIHHAETAEIINTSRLFVPAAMAKTKSCVSGGARGGGREYLSLPQRPGSLFRVWPVKFDPILMGEMSHTVN